MVFIICVCKSLFKFLRYVLKLHFVGEIRTWPPTPLTCQLLFAPNSPYVIWLSFCLLCDSHGVNDLIIEFFEHVKFYCNLFDLFNLHFAEASTSVIVHHICDSDGVSVLRNEFSENSYFSCHSIDLFNVRLLEEFTKQG